MSKITSKTNKNTISQGFIAVIVAILSLGSTAQAAELTLLVQPSHPVEISKQVYQPLIDYLNAVSGNTVTLKSPRDFQQHWLNLRNGETPDLVLEDAPITDYRIQKQGYTPLVRVKEDLTFSILTSGAYADDPLEEFVGKTISTLAAPSLGYLVLLQAFPNPFGQPNISSNSSTWLDGLEIIFSMDADAAVSPVWLVERYQNLYPIYTSEVFPGLTLSASSSVSDEVKAQLVSAMLLLNEDENHYAALTELNATEMVEAKAEDYVGFSNMLNQIYGGR